KSTEEACANLNYVFATTARNRDLAKEIFSPKSSMIKSRNIINEGQGVGIMFGPERAGLQNDDISLAQAIVSVPINPQFSSLNLAQCVVVLAYEWFNLNQKQENSRVHQKGVQYASLIEVEHLRSTLFKNLNFSNYFWPKDKKVSLMENLTNLLGRLPLTSADVRTLHGIIKSLIKR
ncbi:MAG: TrmH family RNA methyltransferase, partial [Paracoccaceae bacterium]|nr:TrmH family RNA methyltransferase [Paracoccaceae bacterium]